MGRPPVEIDEEVLKDLLLTGATHSEVAQEMGVSIPTIANRIAKLQEKQGLLLQYRSLQSLQLTELQLRVLEAITPAKIADASLRDLTIAYKIFKEREQAIEGKPSDLKGLIGFLIQLEKEEIAASVPVETSDEETVEIVRDCDGVFRVKHLDENLQTDLSVFSDEDETEVFDGKF